MVSAAAVMLGLFGCSSASSEEGASPASPPGKTVDPPSKTVDPPVTVPIVPEGAPAFCARPGEDVVRDLFCGESRPTITSLEDLKNAFSATSTGYDGYNSGGFTGSVAVFIGHSTSLSGRLVSPINPRVIVPGGDRRSLIAFQRGVQRVEIAAPDRKDFAPNLYLVTFRQACNDAEHGCVPGDLFTPSIESGWTDVALQDDEELKNTPSDCRQCHQRGLDAPALLMRELQAPWTHFFAAQSNEEQSMLYAGIDGGILPLTYRRAKGDEAYAGFPSDATERTSGFALQLMVDPTQPLLFDAPTIMNERFPYTEGQDWPGPPVRSASWYREYDAFKRGEHLPLPYFDMLVADAEKLTTVSAAYQDYLSGSLAAADLPDLADVFPDDPQTRAEIGLQTEPGATPAQALIQACGGCHNDVLDQSISRARFNVALPKVDAAELRAAVERLGRGTEEPGAMPPPESRQLDASSRQALIAYLDRGEFSEADTEMLTKAAAWGMAGNTETPPVPRTPTNPGF